MWTFGRKIAAGFALAFILLLSVGVVAYRAINSLVDTSDTVTHLQLVNEHMAALFSFMKDAETGQRGYVLTGDVTYLEPYQLATGGAVDRELKALRSLSADDPVHQKLLDDTEQLITAKLSELRLTVDTRRTEGFDAALKLVTGGVGKKYMDELRKADAELEEEEHAAIRQRTLQAQAAATSAKSTIVIGTALCAILVSIAGFTITRSLTDQIGAAVKHVQSSSTELQASANQQASGAKQSATAMNEISTTMGELLVTSRQIAESAQRVAHIAGETAGSARASDQGLVKTSDAVSGIKKQVDVIVSHMLDLGKKSQQIGGILEIINELSEQTNILSINATIEAAGAGDAGKRFSVVADEIRKLADRVGGSTKEIRGLIEEIRSAVNTTVMATEAGTKAVDSGTRQFGELAQALKQIASLVTTTTEAAREIELSTKQQSSAVEQVNSTITSIAQASKETETSMTQTLQTATQLTTLSRELSRLVTAN